MIDGAAFSFEENIAFTREAVDFCKSYGVPVEAELGRFSAKKMITSAKPIAKRNRKR